MRIEHIFVFITLLSCNSKSGSDNANNSIDKTNIDTANKKKSITSGRTYKEQLETTKTYYPFARWRENYFTPKDDPDAGGMKQYTQENCDKTKAVFDNLIAKLISLGQDASEEDKIKLFKVAVLSLNQLDEEIPGLIETGEREDLCELIDKITNASGLNPKNYANGEGIADEWRSW